VIQLETGRTASERRAAMTGARAGLGEAVFIQLPPRGKAYPTAHRATLSLRGCAPPDQTPIRESGPVTRGRFSQWSPFVSRGRGPVAHRRWPAVRGGRWADVGPVSRMWGRSRTRLVAGRVGPGGIQARGIVLEVLGHCTCARVSRLTHSRPDRSARGTRSSSSPALCDALGAHSQCRALGSAFRRFSEERGPTPAPPRVWSDANNGDLGNQWQCYPARTQRLTLYARAVLWRPRRSPPL